MSVTTEQPAPYAPASAVVDIIDKYRNRGLSTPFTSEVLSRAGVTDSLIPRTMQALVTLDLIDSEGNPTETLESLRRAPEPEFKTHLAAWLRAAYADVLRFVEPADGEVAIRDAFRHYNPVGQQSRMVALFMGLCRAAGLRTDEAPSTERRPIGGRGRVLTMARRANTAKGSNPMSRGRVPGDSGGSQGPSNVPAAIAGLLASLPQEGEWTKTERDRFVRTFEAVLDFCFSVTEKRRREEPEGEGDD